MANKQYNSIIRLFESLGISPGSDFNLSRAKKQLQAEFSIADEGFIEIESHTYTKHDVFEELDHPDFIQRLDYHRRIWTSKQLLHFLEENEANMATIRAEFTPFIGDSNFDEFFSPYFVGPFAYLLRNLIAANRLKEAGDLMSYEEFIQPGEREEAFLSVRMFFEENERILRNINGDNYGMMRPKINQWVDSDWHHFFNNLPDEFYEEKNEITAMMINLTVAIQKNYKHDTRAISEQLYGLVNVPDSLKKIIDSNHSVYTGSGSSGFSWRAVAWIVFVLISIGRLANGNGCSDKPEYNFDQFRDISPRVLRFDSTGFDSITIINDKGAKVEAIIESPEARKKKKDLQALYDSFLKNPNANSERLRNLKKLNDTLSKLRFKEN